MVTSHAASVTFSFVGVSASAEVCITPTADLFMRTPPDAIFSGRRYNPPDVVLLDIDEVWF
jgi:hypothetical protein